MALRDIYSAVSPDGTQLQLRHRETDSLIEELPIVKASEEHRAYIISTWIKSYAQFNRKLRTILNGNSFTVSSKDYTDGEARIAETLWNKSHVVTGSKDSFTINAWLCGEPGKLYNAYVPPDLRRMGIFSSLSAFFCGKSFQAMRPWPYSNGKIKEDTWVSYNPYCWLERQQQ